LSSGVQFGDIPQGRGSRWRPEVVSEVLDVKRHGHDVAEHIGGLTIFRD
jgi:hypothetical protein